MRIINTKKVLSLGMVKLEKVDQKNIYTKNRVCLLFPKLKKPRNTTLSGNRKNYHESVTEFYSGKSVFVTGGTGFLGKVLIERILSTCLDIDKVYVLVREKKGVGPEERIAVITSNSLFTKLKQLRPGDLDKIVPIVGDISEPNLGIKSEDQNILTEKVSVVYHSAADTRFNKPLKHLFNVNVEGTEQLLKLCHKMNNIQAFVYVSTAYSNSEKLVIDEIVYPPPRQIEEVYQSVDRINDPKKVKNYIKDKANTYTFTKALAENLVVKEHGNIPAIIVRPSSICSISEEPLPGWLENWYGPTGLVFSLVRGIGTYFHGRKENIMDIIPADYVANLAIVAAASCRTESKDVKVYNSCTSSENPLTFGRLLKKSGEEYRKIYNDNVKSNIYYIKSGWVVSSLSVLVEKIPAYIMDCWLRCTGKKPRYMKELRVFVTRREVYSQFTTQSFIWKTTNAHRLYSSLTDDDQRIFPFDPAALAWDKYIENYCAGVYKHLLNKGDV